MMVVEMGPEKHVIRDGRGLVRVTLSQGGAGLEAKALNFFPEDGFCFPSLPGRTHSLGTCFLEQRFKF